MSDEIDVMGLQLDLAQAEARVRDLEDQLRINALTRSDQEDEIKRLEERVRELEASLRDPHTWADVFLDHPDDAFRQQCMAHIGEGWHEEQLDRLRQCVRDREREALDAAAEADELRIKVRELTIERDAFRDQYEQERREQSEIELHDALTEKVRELEAERDNLTVLRDDAVEMYDHERRKRVDAEQYAADYLVALRERSAEVERLTPLVADSRGAVERVEQLAKDLHDEGLVGVAHQIRVALGGTDGG